MAPVHISIAIAIAITIARTKATFEVPDDWGYAYIELEDYMGRRAWTNPLFVTTPDEN